MATRPSGDPAGWEDTVSITTHRSTRPGAGRVARFRLDVGEWLLLREVLCAEVAGAIDLAAALDYIKQYNFDQVIAHEDDLLRYATNALREINNVRIIGESPDKAGAISFVVENVHPHDLGTFLDHDGVAIRTGHHCAQPVMDFFEIPATARLSFALYNTRQEIDTFSESLRSTVGILS